MTVLDGTATEPVAVQVGVVGTTWTEITAGLTAGQQVVLADLGEPLPGSATDVVQLEHGLGRYGRVPGRRASRLLPRRPRRMTDPGSTAILSKEHTNG